MLVLLDTGLRLSELLNVRLENVDLTQRKIKVMGKGAKERFVFFNTTTKGALKRYIEVRGDNLHHSFLWISRKNEPLNRKALQDRLALHEEMLGYLPTLSVTPLQSSLL